MTEDEFVREWTPDEAAANVVRDQRESPRGALDGTGPLDNVDILESPAPEGGQDAGADHRSGTMTRR
jgi:hypothetical protein